MGAVIVYLCVPMQTKDAVRETQESTIYSTNIPHFTLVIHCYVVIHNSA